MKGEIQLLFFIYYKRWIFISEKVTYILCACKIHRGKKSISNFVLKWSYLFHDKMILQMRQKPKLYGVAIFLEILYLNLSVFSSLGYVLDLGVVWGFFLSKRFLCVPLKHA